MFSDSDSRDRKLLSVEPAAYRRGPGELLLKRLLAHLSMGRLTVVTPAGRRVEQRAAQSGPEATLILHRWRALRRLMAAGDIGFADAYLSGDWSSPDVTAVIEIAAANGPHLEHLIAGQPPVRLWNQFRHLLRLNSKAGSKRNIAFHYDLGNAFYKLWLDQSMTYSSGLYECAGDTLEQAQQAKTRRVLDLLEIDGGERVLEIGCGWGALASAMGKAGAHVTGLTLSHEQLAFAQDRMRREGLRTHLDLRLQDYRDVDGRYDRIVSIEMLEAVGERYWPTYFRTLRERLSPGGTAVLQVITIAEDRLDSYRRSTDFIQRYIFPGGMLPTKGIIAEQARQAGLTPLSQEAFGDSYARTLADWRRRFLAAWPEIEAQGFSDKFKKMWEYYLCYCEAGFRAQAIDVGLYQFRG